MIVFTEATKFSGDITATFFLSENGLLYARLMLALL